MSMLKLYKSYSFRDKDPVIDKLRTIISDEGKSYTEIAVNSGVSRTTLRQWFHGKTQRPQHATVMAVARSMGYDMDFVKRDVSKLHVMGSARK
jgi:transcriptional regulator with XRE-family HTH domain